MIKTLWFLSTKLSQLNCEIAFSSLGEVVLMGAQISAPLLRATPAVQEIGTRHNPLLLRLYAPNSWTQNNQFFTNYEIKQPLSCQWVSNALKNISLIFLGIIKQPLSDMLKKKTFKVFSPGLLMLTCILVGLF